MSSMLYAHQGRATGRHAIDVPETSAEVLARSHALIEHAVDWPHMWHPGDRVHITLSDGQEYVGGVLSVSAATKKVLIELL